MTTFADLNIPKDILRAIEDQGFTTPTEIQEQAIPVSLEGHDIIAGSKTGSGKTLAFGVNLIDYCLPGEGIQALILTPTRELADQVRDSLKILTTYKKLNIISIYGGVSIEPQFEALKKADIVVGTPGRVLDHVNRQSVDFSKVAILVLDEADRMAEMGFIEDVEDIIKVLPEARQTNLFSATIYGSVEHLAEKYMYDPVEISLETHVDPKQLHQCYYDVPSHLKFSLLVHLLKEEDAKLVMIFCNSRQATDFVATNLKANGIDAMAIHGGFSQHKRTKTLEKFNNDDLKALVCTDVAARGLDIQGVTHVYNYDVPKDSKQYVHRIGRTARAGKEGKAVNLLTEMDFDNFDRVLRDNDLQIPKLDMPYVKQVPISVGFHDAGKNGTGRRPSMRGNYSGPRGRSGPKRNFPRR